MQATAFPSYLWHMLRLGQLQISMSGSIGSPFLHQSTVKDTLKKVFGYQNRIMELQREEQQTYIWRHYDKLFRQAKEQNHGLEWHVIIESFIHKSKVIQEKFNYQKKVSQDRNTQFRNNN